MGKPLLDKTGSAGYGSLPENLSDARLTVSLPSGNYYSLKGVCSETRWEREHKRCPVCSRVITCSYTTLCDNCGENPPRAGDVPASRTDHRAYLMAVPWLLWVDVTNHKSKHAG